MRSIGWDPTILGNPNFSDELDSTFEYGSYKETTDFVIDYGDYEGYLIMKCEK